MEARRTGTPPESARALRSLAEALRGRGVQEPEASLAAAAAIAVSRIAFERWIQDARRRDLPELIRESLDRLSAVTAASGA
jgi:hypothetical protein